ncbi:MULTISPECIES: hypothetical protein [Streptomyces]|uniref:Uncharacterized protein n=2 Tax=Streptomyces TaxID=1883 RepID=A0A100Y476_9ACTN|nr:MULTISPECIES: hypothetical protein [Streptomyces]KUH37320.1 hypothetical protein ATE80_18675 [Streptomyces kanasensis]UUS32965.1 hypothetical protein NRO40_20510 [Streptomyces changanensis]
MTTSPISDAALPMPPLTEAALRVAVNRIDLAAAVEFEQEFRQAWQEAIQTDSTTPMHLFIHRWGIWVALRRTPERAARLHELETVSGTAEDRAVRRAASAEIGRMIAEAEREVAA